MKTTTQPSGSTIRLAPGDKGQIYDPDDIDSFFIIDANLRYYFIPIEVVAGFRGISLSAYEQYIVFDPAAAANRALPIASGL